MPTPSPWATDAIDTFITAARLESPPVSLKCIAELVRQKFRIPTTKGMITRRCRTLKLPEAEKSVIPQFAPPPLSPWSGPLPAWHTREADQIVANDNALRCRRKDIAKRFGVPINAVERRLQSLRLQSGDPPVLPPIPAIEPPTRDTIKARRRREAARTGAPVTPLPLTAFQASRAAKVIKVPAPRPEPKPAAEPTPRHASGMRFASSVTSRSFSIAWDKLPKLAPRDGCRWPLTCGEPAVGAFCDAHRGMLR